jgi:pimeloyl-ACP methyl ester carboxylesterase
MRSIEVHYELAGPADAPVLVLSGPLGSTLEIWQPLAERLAERFRYWAVPAPVTTTTAPGMIGHGQSGFRAPVA